MAGLGVYRFCKRLKYLYPCTHAGLYRLHHELFEFGNALVPDVSRCEPYQGGSEELPNFITLMRAAGICCRYMRNG